MVMCSVYLGKLSRRKSTRSVEKFGLHLAAVLYQKAHIARMVLQALMSISEHAGQSAPSHALIEVETECIRWNDSCVTG